MKTKLIIIGIVSLFFVACSSSKTKATPEQVNALDQLVSGQSFVIESNWALPFVSNGMMALQSSGLLAPGDNISRINLNGNANELKLVRGQYFLKTAILWRTSASE